MFNVHAIRYVKTDTNVDEHFSMTFELDAVTSASASGEFPVQKTKEKKKTKQNKNENTK